MIGIFTMLTSCSSRQLTTTRLVDITVKSIVCEIFRRPEMESYLQNYRTLPPPPLCSSTIPLHTTIISVPKFSANAWSTKCKRHLNECVFQGVQKIASQVVTKSHTKIVAIGQLTHIFSNNLSYNQNYKSDLQGHRNNTIWLIGPIVVTQFVYVWP